MYTSVHVSKIVCLYAYMCVCTLIEQDLLGLQMCTCTQEFWNICIRLYTCTCVCVYVCTCIQYVYMNTYLMSECNLCVCVLGSYDIGAYDILG